MQTRRKAEHERRSCCQQASQYRFFAGAARVETRRAQASRNALSEAASAFCTPPDHDCLLVVLARWSGVAARTLAALANHDAWLSSSFSLAAASARSLSHLPPSCLLARSLACVCLSVGGSAESRGRQVDVGDEKRRRGNDGPSMDPNGEEEDTSGRLTRTLPSWRCSLAPSPFAFPPFFLFLSPAGRSDRRALQRRRRCQRRGCQPAQGAQSHCAVDAQRAEGRRHAHRTGVETDDQTAHAYQNRISVACDGAIQGKVHERNSE